MATAGDGAATANNNTGSSHGVGGAGGKFRKKLFRRQSTPYDRPPNAIRGSSSNSSWLTKLVVDPASKLISYGAERFFASVFRKRLPPPPPPPPPSRPEEVKDVVNDPVRGEVLDYGAQKPVVCECSQPANSSSSNTISELEQLLKQKTFTRSEIDHLKELLQSRVEDVSCGNDSKRNEDTAASDFGRHRHANGSLEENGEGIRSPAVMSRIFNSKVIENDIASPAELAKAYMGIRPSKVSPSALGMRSQAARENKDLLSNMSLASKSTSLPLTLKTSVGLHAPENGFITPRSRGRTAIYNMARSPYSRFHPNAALKESGDNTNSYAKPATPSSALSLVENGQKFETRPMTLKRGSSALDDEVVSVGPIRRIRQKPNLLAPRTYDSAHGLRIGTDTKQKLKSTGEQRYKVSETVREIENGSVPMFNRAHVPSQSSEMAARIFQHLENLAPKEKSSGSKLVAEQKQSPLKLMPSMSGKALRSMGDLDSKELLLVASENNKLGDRATTMLPDARDSSPQKQGKVEENRSKEFLVHSDMRNPMTGNDSAVSLKASGPCTRATDSVVKTGVSQLPQKQKVFRMSADEDYLEQDDDAHCDALAVRTSSENKGTMSAPLTVSKFSPAEEPKLLKMTVQPEVPKLVKTTVQPEVESPSSLISNQKSQEDSPGPVTVGEGSNTIAFPFSEATGASKSALLPVSIPAFDKPKEATDPRAVFGFSSKVADTSLPSETSSKKEESKLEGSSSLVNISTSAGSQIKLPEIGKDGPLNPLKAGDINGKSNTLAPVRPDGPFVSRPPSMSFAAACSNDVNQPSTGGSLLSTPSTSIPSLGTSKSATSSTSIFGLAGPPSVSAGPVLKFSASIEPSDAAASGSAISSEVAELKRKVEIDPSSGGSSSSLSTLPAFAAASSGSSSSGLGSSLVGYSTQGSLFSSTSFGSTSQVFGPKNNIFGAGSSASASQTSAVVPTDGLTSSTVKFVAVSSVSEGNATTSTSGATPSIFGFGQSSSTSTSAVGSSSGATTPAFSFGGSSSVSSFSSGISGTFNFGGSSSASSPAINPFSSNSAPSNVFGASWQSPKSSIFGSTFASPSPSTGFSFTTSSAPANAAPMLFNSSNGASSSSVFSFTSASASVLSSPPVPTAQPVFGTLGFTVTSGNHDQMNGEDSMAEDPIQASAPSAVPVFGQPSVSPSPPGFAFGSQPSNPFMFGGQQNQVATAQNTPPFQASSSLEFNAGGSFSLGSGGGDKSGRRIVKPSRNKNRRK